MKSLGVDKPLDGNIKPVKDSDGTMSAIELSTGKVRVKGLEVTGTTLLAGGTFAGDIDMSDNDIGNVDAINTVKLSIGTSGLVKNIRDEDDMSHDDVEALVTQQSVKAYVDNTVLQTAVVTLTTAQCTALHSTAITLVAAQGSNMITLVQDVVLFVDRAATQTNAACDLFISYNGATSLSTGVIKYKRRFMNGVTTDMIFTLSDYTGVTGVSLAEGNNQPVTVKVDAPITSGCMTSMKFVVKYYVYDNS